MAPDVGALRARIDAVLFDWGDTLFRSPSAAQVILAAARERGVALDEGAAQALWDRLWEAGKSPEEHAKGRDLSADAHRAVWTALFARADAVVPGLSTLLYERVMDQRRWTPYADTRPVLEALRARGVRTGVVSNHAIDLRPLFARHRLGALVDAFALSYEHGVAKPDPALFAVACRALGVPAAHTLMVGDDPVSDGGAAQAGLQVYLLSPDGSGETRGLEPVVALVDASRLR